MIPILDDLDLRDPGQVMEALDDGARASVDAACRRGAIDHITVSVGRSDAAMAGTLIASGDLHDHPLHLARLLRAAGVHLPPGGAEPPAHLTLHELIHPDELTGGLDFSFRVLARAARVKSCYPEHAHVLLANHELAQLTGALVAKNGVRYNQAFNDGVAARFPDHAADVLAAVRRFLRALPLALRIDLHESGPGERRIGSILCAHSLPQPELLHRFDHTVLERDLIDDDYAPRTGAAHLMTWGRGHAAESLAALGERWAINLFILGHEKADDGCRLVEPNAVILNSDHPRGVYLELPLDRAPTLRSIPACLRPLAEA